MNRPARVAHVPQDITLVELVNRVLDRGVVVSGEVLIIVAGIDLVSPGLEVCLSSVETARQKRIVSGGI